MSNLINWKSRYAELIDQQEKQQTRYRKKNLLLTGALQDTIALARRIDQNADEKLLALKALVREDKVRNADLEPVVLAVAKQAQASLECRKKSLEHMRKEFILLARHCRGLTDASEIQLTAAEFEKQLDSEIHYSDIELLVTQAVALVKNTSAAAGHKVSLWSRWFGGAKSAGNAEGDMPVATEIPATIADSLARLINQLDAPEEFEQSVELIRHVLTGELDMDSVSEVIQAICDIVLATLKRDRREFEQFLNDLNDRLRIANQQLNLSESNWHQELDASKRLDTSLRAQVGQLQQKVGEAQDLDALKKEVSQNLENIVGLMDDHQSSSDQRQQTLSQQLAQLVNQAKAMESASKEAEAQVEAQRQRAMTDSLTGLPNRDAWEERANQDLERWRKEAFPLCLALVDLDLFKSLNDSYGHEAGDEVLRQVAQLLQQQLPETAYLARFGGEEFAVLLPGIEREDALAIMEKARYKTDEHVIAWQGHHLRITLSAGIADFKGKDIIASVFTRADRALHQAKHTGRNRAVLAMD